MIGKGGTAPNPAQTRDGEVGEVDLVEPTSVRVETEGKGSFTATEANSSIVEAQGWIVNDRGVVELVASKTDLDGSPAQPKSIQVCHQQ